MSDTSRLSPAAGTVCFRNVSIGLYAAALILAGFFGGAVHAADSHVEISGKLAKWHEVSLTFDGPQTSEKATPNPFTDYRLDVVFVGPSDQKYVVPGFYAADGNAAITGAESGDKWRVCFSADESGEWSYSVRFVKGAGVALADKPQGESGGYMDGMKGSFAIGPADGPGNGFYSKGRLQYVGERYERFAETGEYFLKVGADAPENIFAYEDFDATPNVSDRRKTWAPHLKDYSSDADDLLWGPDRDKGKALLGAVNYLSGKGMNVFSFLTFNVAGDDENVFMHIVKRDLADYEANHGKKTPDKAWTTSIERLRMDISKTAQWDRVMQYADRKGMFLHFKTSEAENCKLMDNGDLGPERRLYFRELVARFGYHLALNWNFGEENSQTTEQHQSQMAYVKRIDPYNHLRVVHTFPGVKDNVYGPLLGDKSELTGLSLQTSNPAFTKVYGDVKKWVLLSEATGKPWVVACDEPGDATHALVTDGEDPDHDNARINGLWGTFMAGGCGTEWYFGYKHPHSDLTCEDWRSRDKFWDQGKIALDFFYKNDVPFWKMQPTLTKSGDWALVGDGCVVVFVKSGGKTVLDLPEAEFTVSQTFPKTGGSGSYGKIQGKAATELSVPVEGDVVFLLKTDQEELKFNLGGADAPKPVVENPTTPAFAFNYDPTNAKKVHKQSDGILVVEAEGFDAVDREDARKWCLTTVDKTPGIRPDPDPNHAAGAVGGAYLELLPDTRVTHGDPLVRGVSFTNTPGQCSVLYYPVIFTEPGRYYVWVRTCCTGSEDNGLHVGLDGDWPASGARLQFTGKHGQWQWDSRQRTNKVHTGVLGQIWLDVDKPGLHTIMFSMREDGFEFDRFMLTKQQNAMESKNSEAGPAASPKVQ
ncbi:MAG: DUF5060 domain-containing protein [Planctomycetes bacterium]|nr:DUF5060 domain-containing protein [Planctomycetota bacterium]